MGGCFVDSQCDGCCLGEGLQAGLVGVEEGVAREASSSGGAAVG